MRDCERSLACAIRGPVMLIVVGGLFALAQFTEYGIQRTWPVLLILLGLLKLAELVGDPGPNSPGGVR